MSESGVWLGGRDERGGSGTVASFPDGLRALQRGTWLLPGGASVAAIALLLHFGIAVERFSLCATLSWLVGLGAIYGVYTWWRPIPAVSHLSGVLLTMGWSAGMAGVISLVSLRSGAPLVDGFLAEADQFLGLDTQAYVRSVASSRTCSTLLGLAYVSAFPFLFGAVSYLALTRRFARLWQLAFMFAATILIAAFASIFMPAKGAFTYYDYPPSVLAGLPEGAGTYYLPAFEFFRNASSPVLSFDSLQGVVVFPSFHCCLALLTIFACHGIRGLSIAAWLWNGLVFASVLPIGGHYAIDLIGGVAVFMIAAAAAMYLSERDVIRDDQHATRIGRDPAMIRRWPDSSATGRLHAP